MASQLTANLIALAAERLRAGGVVAIPTETVYGFPLDEEVWWAINDRLARAAAGSAREGAAHPVSRS